jgi:alcohol dehydrogenase class IV
MFDAPHGAVCAALLPAVLRVNARALAARAPDAPALARLREVAALVTGRPDAAIDEGVAWIADLTRALEIPGLGRHGLTPARIPELVAKARAASSMKGNPIALTDEELTEIVEASS